VFYKIKNKVFYMGGVDDQVNELIFCGGWHQQIKKTATFRISDIFGTTIGKYGLCLNQLLSRKPHQHPSKGGI
jgi:hypothetical protein